jgi:hypothetical protein
MNGKQLAFRSSFRVPTSAFNQWDLPGSMRRERGVAYLLATIPLAATSLVLTRTLPGSTSTVSPCFKVP